MREFTHSMINDKAERVISDKIKLERVISDRWKQTNFDIIHFMNYTFINSILKFYFLVRYQIT